MRIRYLSQSLAGHQGIAIGPILFVIAALAVIAAAIAASSGAFTAGTTQESASTQAATIIQVGQQLRDAVSIVVNLNGCADTQISFSNPVITAVNGGVDYYSNSNSPPNGSCNVFSPSGGAIQFPTVTASTDETAYDNGYFVFQSNNAVRGLGSNVFQTGNELMGFLPVDSAQVCQAIDSQLGLSQWFGGASNYFSSQNGNGHFYGGYYNQWTIGDGGVTWPNARIMGCMVGTKPLPFPYFAPVNAGYFFYVVLLVR